MSESDAELLLVGEGPRDDTSHVQVLDFVESVRGTLVESVDEAVAVGHLSAVAQAARERPAATPQRKRRRPIVRRSPLVALAAAALALCLALGSFGVLPRPVQARLADASRAVGIPLPKPESAQPERHEHKPSARGGPPVAPASHPAPAWHPAPTPALATPPAEAPAETAPSDCVLPDADTTCPDEPGSTDTTTTTVPQTETQDGGTEDPDQSTTVPAPGADGQTTTPEQEQP
jgi:hypothetical protein